MAPPFQLDRSQQARCEVVATCPRQWLGDFCCYRKRLAGVVLLHSSDTPCMDVLFTCYARVDQSAQLNVLAYKNACFTNGLHGFPGIPYGNSFGAPVSGADLFPNANKFR